MNRPPFAPLVAGAIYEEWQFPNADAGFKLSFIGTGCIAGCNFAMSY